MDIEKYRREMPIVDHYTFLDHANMSPSPRQVLDTVKKVMEGKVNHAYLPLNDLNKQVETTREDVAKLLGASRKEEIWFMNTASMGLSVTSNMQKWNKNDNVVLSDLEFPSNVYPWLKLQKKGVEVRYTKSSFDSNGAINVSLNEFEKLIDDRTKVVAVSSVDYQYGYKFNLKRISEIAHEHGALVVVDACQSVGAMRTRAKEDDVDIITFGGQKWTLAPSAGGGFFIKNELISQFEPPNIGWLSVTRSKKRISESNYKTKYTLREDAMRFAHGHLNYLCILGFGASTKFLLDAGIGNIEKRVLNLNRRLMEKLADMDYQIMTPRDDEKRAGIVSFKIDDSEKKIEKLRRKNILVSLRGPGIRVSPHFYNNEEEIYRLLNEIRE